ncbi:MAG: hypothetical protein AAFQ89_16710 [Cyanobacteria bacterium J06626_18]
MDKKRKRGALLFISILLHSLFVLLPWQEPQKEKARPVQNSTGPISIVDANQVPTLRASEPQPALSSPPSPAVPPSPPVAPPAALPDTPPPETSDSLNDEPTPEAAPDSDTAPGSTPSAGPATPNSVTPANGAKIAAEWEYLASYLKDQDESFGFSPFDIFDLFGTPEQISQFFDENNQPKFDVSSFYFFPEQTPDQVFRDVVMPELNSNTGFEPQPQENFPAGLAYQLLQGEMLRYLIIVKLDEDNGSVLMLSESLPGLES